MKAKFTSQQLNDYLAYEEVRQSSKYNMLMQSESARLEAGLTREEYSFVRQNFDELRAAYEEGK